MNLIEQAIAHVGGVTAFTKLLNEQLGTPISYQAVRKWAARGRLPRTDWTGESNYASAIDRLTGGVFAREDLLRLDNAKPTDASEA